MSDSRRGGPASAAEADSELRKRPTRKLRAEKGSTDDDPRASQRPTQLDTALAVTAAGALISIGGSLSAATIQVFQAFLAEGHDHPGDVVLDLDGLRYIDSTGVGRLLELVTRLRSSGRRVEVVGLSGQPRQVLALVGALPMLTP